MSDISNIPRGIALWLRRICDEDKTLKKRSSEYQNYLIARDNKPIVKKQFSEVKKKTRSEARQKQTKAKVSDLKFITTYNPALPNIHYIIQNNPSILHIDENVKKIFPSKSMKTLYWREKNRKHFLSPSLFSAKPNNSESCITSCKKCEICKSYLITDNKLSVKLLAGFMMSEAICVVTAVMLSTWFVIKSVKISI